MQGCMNSDKTAIKAMLQWQATSIAEDIGSSAAHLMKPGLRDLREVMVLIVVANIVGEPVQWPIV